MSGPFGIVARSSWSQEGEKAPYHMSKQTQMLADQRVSCHPGGRLALTIIVASPAHARSEKRADDGYHVVNVDVALLGRLWLYCGGHS